MDNLVLDLVYIAVKWRFLLIIKIKLHCIKNI